MAQEKRTLIIIGGESPLSIVPLDLSIYDYIIAADSGYDSAKRLGIRVDDAIGDFDSTSNRNDLIKKGFVPCPHDKADTDFVLALKKKRGDYDLIGGGGGRMDHLVAIFSAFKHFGGPKIWLTKYDVIFSSSHFKAKLRKNSTISFFPSSLDESATVTTEGLTWNLKDQKIDLSYISLSNRAEKEEVEIRSSHPLLIRFDMDIFQSGINIILC